MWRRAGCARLAATARLRVAAVAFAHWRVAAASARSLRQRRAVIELSVGEGTHSNHHPVPLPHFRVSLTPAPPAPLPTCVSNSASRLGVRTPVCLRAARMRTFSTPLSLFRHTHAFAPSCSSRPAGFPPPAPVPCRPLLPSLIRSATALQQPVFLGVGGLRCHCTAVPPSSQQPTRAPPCALPGCNGRAPSPSRAAPSGA